MKTDQNLVWRNLSEKENLAGLLKIHDQKAVWRVHLVELINDLFVHRRSGIHILEAGSSYGLTSALLNSTFNISLLDLDKVALDKAKDLFRYLNREVDVIHSNIFDLNKLDKKFDIVYNAGVIEHFDYDDRNKIIYNMSTVVNEGGFVVIAFPNHDSFPYRMGYLYQQLTKKWIYPKENKIKIEKQRFNDSNLVLLGIYDFDDRTVFDFLPRPIRRILKKLNMIIRFQGYLKVAIFQKTNASISNNPIR